MNNNQLQSSYLDDLLSNHTHISIYLINGIKLSGYIYGIDDTCILMRDNKNTVTQLIYKHAISTIVPAKSTTVEFEAE
ncbi:MAG: RNA chaperone Hfq [Burkholderiales bacterium]|nr:RNA chaperone Hfq [Burkholderiales bacterium]